MRVHLVTLRYSPQHAAFDDAPLRAALDGASILTLREYFFVAEDLPHLLCVVTCAATADRGAHARGHGAVPVAPPTAGPDARDATTPRPSPRDDLDADGQVVYDRLRRWRAHTAKEEGVPPYVVLTNRQLSGIVQAKPQSKAALGRVDNVGNKKVERYGEALGAPTLDAVFAAQPSTRPGTARRRSQARDSFRERFRARTSPRANHGTRGTPWPRRTMPSSRLSSPRPTTPPV